MNYRECQVSSRRILGLSLLLCFSIFAAACGQSTEAFLAKGEEYLQKRKFHDAMMQFRSAAESDSGSARAHWGLARSYENLGQFNEALEELRKTVELDETNLDAKAKLGNYFLLLVPPMVAEAETIRDEILEADPKFIEGHMLTASIMAALGQPDADVVAAVNRAIALNPKRIESYISLQRLYMTRDKTAEAEAALNTGISAVPDSVLGYIEYGRFLTYANRDAEAETQFLKAISLDGANIEARQAIADFYVVSRQMEKAERAYLSLLEIQENSPESRLELAEFYERVGRTPEGIAVLEQILADAPGYALARYRVGQIYLDQGNIAKVNEQLDELFKINDNDLEALMLRSRLHLREGSPEKAVKDLEEVLKRIPSGREPLYLMSQSRLAAGQVDQANSFIMDLERYHPNYLQVGLLKIQSAFTIGDSQGALKQSNELLDKIATVITNAGADPKSLQDMRVRALTSRGLANMDLGKLPEARADLQAVVQMSPRSASAAVNLAKVHMAGRGFEAAMELYEKALALDAQNFDAASGIVNAALRLQRPAIAHSRVNELINNNGGNPALAAGLHYLRSTVYSSEQNHSAAERELLAAIDLDNGYLPAYSGYAALLVKQNRADEGIAQYRKVLEMRPTAQIFTLLGILEDSRGNGAAAEEAYRKALEIAPDTSIAANNLAWLLAERQGNLDEALQWATSAVSKSPTTAGFYDTLGWIYLKKGLALPAVEQLRRAVALEETNSKRTGITPNAGYRVRLGMALARAGDKTGARREAEISLRFTDSLSHREVSDARGVLAGS